MAIHYACQSLRSGEADLALAGGVNVMTRPEYPIIMSKGHFLSDHGECRAFDESAAGYARGEGAGVFLIKPLTKAVSDGDPIHAVIRGSGVNSDGHTEGLSLPNASAQSELVREVYERAGVAPGEVDYVEAHGTGTQAGDPAELAALNANFSVGRETPLWVGSVKTNVGHLEAAAGVAGMMKAIGVLKYRQIPKNLHFKTPNPRIPFADYDLRVVTETTDLPGADERATLFVGVNGFGYGGTNGHVLLESAPVVDGEAGGGELSGAGFFPFSAASEAALRDLTGKWAFLLGRGQGVALGDLAHTVAYRRSHLATRCVVFGSERGGVAGAADRGVDRGGARGRGDGCAWRWRGGLCFHRDGAAVVGDGTGIAGARARGGAGGRGGRRGVSGAGGVVDPGGDAGAGGRVADGADGGGAAGKFCAAGGARPVVGELGNPTGGGGRAQRRAR